MGGASEGLYEAGLEVLSLCLRQPDNLNICQKRLCHVSQDSIYRSKDMVKDLELVVPVPKVDSML